MALLESSPCASALARITAVLGRTSEGIKTNAKLKLPINSLGQPLKGTAEFGK